MRQQPRYALQKGSIVIDNDHDRALLHHIRTQPPRAYGPLRAKGLEDEEDLIRGIQEHFGLRRLAISARQRFEAAVRAESPLNT
jgi:hypothetical protein